MIEKNLFIETFTALQKLNSTMNKIGNCFSFNMEDGELPDVFNILIDMLVDTCEPYIDGLNMDSEILEYVGTDFKKDNLHLAVDKETYQIENIEDFYEYLCKKYEYYKPLEETKRKEYYEDIYYHWQGKTW